MAIILEEIVTTTGKSGIERSQNKISKNEKSSLKKIKKHMVSLAD